jgi:hypothetical protein
LLRFARLELTLIKALQQRVGDSRQKFDLERLMPAEDFAMDSTFDSEHPAARFAVDGALQLELCRSLLDLAEHLPGRPDREGIAYCLKVLPSTWEAHVAFQSEAAFPLLKRRYEGDRDVLKCLGRLERHHIEIAGANDELIEQLVHVLNGEIVDCEMLGYLIRNAAERRREHVEWEQSFLNSLFPRLLVPLERQAFLAWSSANPWPLKGTEELGKSNK